MAIINPGVHPVGIEFNDDELIQAIKMSNGTYGNIAGILNTHHTTIIQRIDRSEAATEFLALFRKKLLNDAEGCLSDLMSHENEMIRLKAATSVSNNLTKYYIKSEEEDVENITLTKIIDKLITNAESGHNATTMETPSKTV